MKMKEDPSLQLHEQSIGRQCSTRLSGRGYSQIRRKQKLESPDTSAFRTVSCYFYTRFLHRCLLSDLIQMKTGVM